MEIGMVDLFPACQEGLLPENRAPMVEQVVYLVDVDFSLLGLGAGDVVVVVAVNMAAEAAAVIAVAGWACIARLKSSLA